MKYRMKEMDIARHDMKNHIVLMSDTLILVFIFWEVMHGLFSR